MASLLCRNKSGQINMYVCKNQFDTFQWFGGKSHGLVLKESWVHSQSLPKSLEESSDRNNT